MPLWAPPWTPGSIHRPFLTIRLPPTISLSLIASMHHSLPLGALRCETRSLDLDDPPAPPSSTSTSTPSDQATPECRPNGATHTALRHPTTQAASRVSLSTLITSSTGRRCSSKDQQSRIDPFSTHRLSIMLPLPPSRDQDSAVDSWLVSS